MVTLSAVIGAVLASWTCSSMNQGLLLVTAPAMVALPPPPGLATVSARVAVRAVSPLAVPVTVTLALPSVAVEEAARVTTVELPVVDAGLNAALTPVGSPLAANDTAPVKPPVRVSVHVDEPFAPRLTVRLVGLHAMV